MMDDLSRIFIYLSIYLRLEIHAIILSIRDVRYKQFVWHRMMKNVDAACLSYYLVILHILRSKLTILK